MLGGLLGRVVAVEAVVLVGPAASTRPLVPDVGVANVVELAPTLLVEAVGGVLLLAQVEGEAG